MASFDRVISISKTVDKYVNKIIKDTKNLQDLFSDQMKSFFPKFSPTQDFIDNFTQYPKLKG